MIDPNEDPRLLALGWSPEFLGQAPPPTDTFPARVCIQHRGRFTLLGPHGPLEALPPNPAALPDDPIDPNPCVGDWALVRATGQSDLVHITRVLPRRSSLVRKAPGRRSRPQLVAANLDRVFLVTSMNADFSARRLERYVAAALAGGVTPVVVLSKADLRLSEQRRFEAQAQAVAEDVTVISTSAALEMGIEELRAQLAFGRTVGFVGSSGVGKSSLVNALLGEQAMLVEAIRARDDTGQHTTTHRELLPLPNKQGVLLDTPGMREFQPWSAEGLDAVFTDLERLAERCRYRGCQHQSEPGCAVLEAVQQGTLEQGRLENYGRMQREAAHLDRRVTEHQRRKEARRFGRMVRDAQRRKRR